MSLDRSFLEYPQLRHGMDHARYSWSMLAERPAVRWPDDKPLALWINLSLEYFPLNPKGEGFRKIAEERWTPVLQAANLA